MHRVEAGVTAASLNVVLASTFFRAGYTRVVVYDPINGFQVAAQSGLSIADADETLRQLGLTPANGKAAAGLDLFGIAIERLANQQSQPVALIAEFASRLMVRSDSLSAVEHQLFTRALVLSQKAQARPVGPDRQAMFNPVIWIADKEGDVPDWFLIGNPRIRHIPIAVPDRSVRRALVPGLVRSLPGAREATSETLVAAENDFVDDTEGLLVVDLNGIAQLARSENIHVAEIPEAIRRFKVGVTDDAWKKIEHQKISSGATTIGKRVIGQDHAVTHLLDIVKRAAIGLAGAKRGGRPRGVAFLAGPTGVGKTELAKAVTELLFGDESAYIRFDMSEFSAEHADQRLIGAPPGYVGYDVGGELTNAIREKPFSVVLFDEIEKAHPRILDKFLQILDDGVLTSGRGDRVYFSECLIIFTSNLGIYTGVPGGARKLNVGADEPFDVVQAKVKSEIESYFKQVLNRPELLNRIGDNVIVFDFIRATVADQIFEAMLSRILSDAKASGYPVQIASAAKEQLRKLCTSDLSNGGRGIRNKLETYLINPLARALFDQAAREAATLTEVVVGDSVSVILEFGA